MAVHDDLKSGGCDGCAPATSEGQGGFPAIAILEKLKQADIDAAGARAVYDSIVDELGITLCSIATSRGIDKTGFRVGAEGLAIGGCEVSHDEARRLRDFMLRMYGPWESRPESGPELHAKDRDELVDRMAARMILAVAHAIPVRIADRQVCQVKAHTKAIVEDVLDHVGVRIIADAPATLPQPPVCRLGPGGDFTMDIPARA